jgi:hypothetical protein
MIILDEHGKRVQSQDLTDLDKQWVEADNVQNCSISRNKWELGIEPETYSDRLEAAEEMYGDYDN